MKNVVHVDFKKKVVLPPETHKEKEDREYKEAIRKILERAEKSDW